jgi:hypothetical protein
LFICVLAHPLSCLGHPAWAVVKPVSHTRPIPMLLKVFNLLWVVLGILCKCVIVTSFKGWPDRVFTQ